MMNWMRVPIRRLSGSLNTSYVYHSMGCRQLISVDGREAFNLLQGLITNDLLVLQANNGASSGCLYSMMLNSLGRVLYDVLIYSKGKKPPASDGYILECDKQLAPDVVKHLNTFKMRKKVEIRLREDIRLWTLFQSQTLAGNEKLTDSNFQRADDVQWVKENEALDIVKDDSLMLLADPRHSALGFRLILNDGKLPKDVLNVDNLLEAEPDAYQVLRYRLGIGEGPSDHPPANCFPLECNADYLRGVSFHKGCYLGQELTARTHHTGVMRSRLLPLVFTSSSSQRILTPSSVLEMKRGPEGKEQEKRVGKFRNRVRDYGLAVLNIQKCLHSSTRIFLKTTDNELVPVETYKPFWWPQSTSQENVDLL